MRHIRDHAFLFSLANINRGEIIACRSSCWNDAVGQNFVSYLGIDKGELEFISNKLEFGSDNIFFVSKIGGICRPAAIFRFFSYSTSLALAVVFDLPVSAVAMNMRDGVIEFSCASAGLLMLSKPAACTSEELDDAYVYLSDVLDMLAPLFALRLQYSLPSRSDLRSAAEGAARFVGAKIDFFSLDLSIEDGYLDEVGNVFSGPMCAATFILGALVAREVASDRTLKANAFWGYRSFYLLCSFKPLDDTVPSPINLLINIADSRNMPMKAISNSGSVEIKLSPFYSDVGMFEVKEFGGPTRLTDVEIKLYNYPGITLDILRQ